MHSTPNGDDLKSHDRKISNGTHSSEWMAIPHIKVWNED